jgi:hypothetical protein
VKRPPDRVLLSGVALDRTVFRHGTSPTPPRSPAYRDDRYAVSFVGGERTTPPSWGSLALLVGVPIALVVCWRLLDAF